MCCASSFARRAGSLSCPGMGDARKNENRRKSFRRFLFILFSNRNEPFDNRSSGNASLPDSFSLNCFAIWERWGISSPIPLARGPEPSAPSGRRSLAERRESQGATLVARLCEFPGSVPRPLLRLALIAHFYLRKYYLCGMTRAKRETKTPPGAREGDVVSRWSAIRSGSRPRRSRRRCPASPGSAPEAARRRARTRRCPWAWA